MTQQIRVTETPFDGRASATRFDEMAEAYKLFDQLRADPGVEKVSIEVIKPAGDLIRLWDGNFAAAGHVIAPFDRGFTVPADHPVARFLVTNWQNLDAINVTNVTVESSSEFHWKIRSIITLPGSRVQVACEPWIDGLRKTIVSDEHYLENVANQATDGEAQS